MKEFEKVKKIVKKQDQRYYNLSSFVTGFKPFFKGAVQIIETNSRLAFET